MSVPSVSTAQKYLDQEHLLLERALTLTKAWNEQGIPVQHALAVAYVALEVMEGWT